jgi:hypothetical protein
VPPVDRLNPIRAASSESSCYLLEFVREFPDDEACLQYVWRERFSEDGEHAGVRAAKPRGRSSATRRRTDGPLGTARRAAFASTR